MLEAQTLPKFYVSVGSPENGELSRWQNIRTSISRAAMQTRQIAGHVWENRDEIARNAAKNTIENSPYIAAGAVARAVSAPLLTPIGAAAVGAGVSRYGREIHQMDKKGAKRYFADNVLRHKREDSTENLGIFNRVKKTIDQTAHGLEVRAVKNAFRVEETGNNLEDLQRKLSDKQAAEGILADYQNHANELGVEAIDLLVSDMAEVSLAHLTGTSDSQKRKEANTVFMQLYGALKLADPNVIMRDLRSKVWEEIKEDRKEAGHKSARGLALVAAAKAPVKVLTGAAIAEGVGKIANWIRSVGENIQVDLNPTSEDIASMVVTRAAKKAAATAVSEPIEATNPPIEVSQPPRGVKVNGLAAPVYNPGLEEELASQNVTEVEPQTITLTVDKGGSISQELQEAGILPDFNEKGSGKVILSLIDSMKEEGKLTDTQAQELINAIAENPDQSWAELYNNHPSAFKGMDLVHPNFKFEVAIEPEETNIRVPVTNSSDQTTANLKGGNLNTHHDTASSDHVVSDPATDANSQSHPDTDVIVESGEIKLENATKTVIVSTNSPDILGFQSATPQGWVEQYGGTPPPNNVNYYYLTRDNNTNLVLGFHAGYFTDPETGIKYEQIGEGFRQNMEGGALGSGRVGEAQILENIKDAEDSNLELRLTDDSGNSAAYKLENITYWSPEDVAEKGFNVRYPENNDLLTVIICGRSHTEALNMLTDLKVPAYLNDYIAVINNPNSTGDQIMTAVAELEVWLKANNPALYQKFYDHFYYKLEDGKSWTWSKYVLTFTKQN